MRQSWQRILMVRSAAIAAAAFVALSFAATPARAQCGSPPDPRTNTAGYASWCSCMGGSYNYQTTACTGARGPLTGGGAQRGGGSWPAQHWYCRARASNGASGWGRYGDRAAAERSALSYCDQYAKGRACRIVNCTYVGGTPPADSAAPSYSGPSYSAPSPPPTTSQPSTPAPGFTPFRQPTATCGGRKCLAGQICGPTNRCYDPQRHFYCGKTRCVTGRHYSANSACGRCTAPQPKQAAPRLPFPFGAKTCGQCYGKLLNDIRFGHLTARPRSYITHAIAGYDTCKAQAQGKGDCTDGERFKAAAGGCRNPGFNEAGVRACVSNVLIGAPPP